MVQNVSNAVSTSNIDNVTLRADRKLAHSSAEGQQTDKSVEYSPLVDSADANRYTLRSHTCGELCLLHENSVVQLSGWIESTRLDRFLLLRDAYGTTQVTVPDSRTDLKEILKSLSLESVVYVEGTVVRRPSSQKNAVLFTGEIEVEAKNITVLGAAQKELPFLVRRYNEPTEQLSMKHRYLHLRFPKIQGNLRLRSQVMHRMRDFLVHANFVEVETPTLFRKTPGGAQEFVVPTQIPGHFYSLVQSPQQFKQLLMVGGLDRYFQIARCYRDEKVKSDRQPEFTQLDLELSFVDREGILALVEDLLVACWPGHLPALQVPFPRMTYRDAMDNYGSDKPDRQFEWRLRDLSHLAEPSESGPAQQFMGTPGFAMCSLVLPGAADHVTRSRRDDLKKRARAQWPDTWLLDAQIVDSDSWHKSLLKTLSRGAVQRIAEELRPQAGDLLLLGLGPRDHALGLLGTLRVQVADLLEAAGMPVRDSGRYDFLWVEDFPLFEAGVDGSLQSAHHPFTQPHPEDLSLLDTDPLKVRGLHYDLVLNGAEVGGGSIRISDPDLQQRLLHDLLRLDTSALQHLMDALSMGAPPHGGIALGLDRLMAIICGASSIREVIAFPKGLSGKDPMAGSPAPLTLEDANLYQLPLRPQPI